MLTKDNRAMDISFIDKTRAIKGVCDDGNNVNDIDIVDVYKIAKSKSLIKPKAGFFILEIRLTFMKLRLAFIKAPILNHFNTKYNIQIKTDVLSYIISGIWNYLTSNNSAQWHLMAFYSEKIISVKTQYKIYGDKLLAIVEVLKT